jgi:ribosomal protein S18 acetylase RimI-like enzyme
MPKMSGSFIIRPIAVPELSKVAMIHKKAFQDSALTKLGLEPIRRYYEWQLTGPHDCYAIGVFNTEDELTGFCFGGIFRGALSGFLQKNQKFLVTWILTHPWLILNPLVTDRIKIALRIRKKVTTPSKPKIEADGKSFGVLSIAVDPERQGLGIGRLLMDVVEAEARKGGFQQLHLTVHPTNIQAVSFYERCGWNKVLTECEAWNGGMRKSL